MNITQPEMCKQLVLGSLVVFYVYIMGNSFMTREGMESESKPQKN